MPEHDDVTPAPKLPTRRFPRIMLSSGMVGSMDEEGTTPY